MKKIILLLAVITCSTKTIYAQWESTSGFATGIVKIKGDGTNLVAEGDFYKCFLSTNNGDSWTFINNITNSHPNAIVKNGNDIYIGTDNGLFYSNDGATWVLRGLFTSVYSVAVRGNALVIGYISGVALSNDKGVTWTQLGSIPVVPKFVAFLDTTIIAGTARGFFLSTNMTSQAQWLEKNNSSFNNSSVFSVATMGTKTFVLDGNGRVNLSTDNANNWTLKPQSSIFYGVTELAVSGTNIWTLNDNNELYYSQNDGDVWQRVNHTLPKIYSLSANGTNITLGTSKGAFTSTDNGLNWKIINKGLQIDVIESLQSDGKNLYARTQRDSFYMSIDNGLNWTPKRLGLPYNGINAILADSTSVYVGTYSGLFKSTNNGQTFSNHVFSTPIYALSRKGNTICVGASDRVSWSFNNGENWTLNTLSSMDSRYGSLAISEDTLFSASGNASSMYVCNKNGDFIGIFGHPSTDDIKSLAFNNGILYLGTRYRAYTSKNHARSFEPFGSGDSGMETVLFRDSNVIIPSPDRGVNVTTTNNPNWRSVNKNLANLKAYSLVIHKNHLLVGTHVGVFRIRLSEVIAVNNPPNDMCQNAATFTPSVFLNGTTANATAETSPSRVLPCETNQNVRDVWYKFRSDTGALRPFRMQLTLTQGANSTAFKYAVYAGSCSDFILRGACKTVALNSTILDTIVLSEANQDYYIRVWSADTTQEAAFSIKIQNVQNFNAVPIAQATTTTVCQPFASVNISAANSQKWNTLMDGNAIVAEINPNSNVLGQVTGGYFINLTGTIRRASGTPYLDRNIGIKVTNQPTTNVSVRLYFTERERAAYFAVVGANPLAVTHYAGALCLATVQTGSGELLPASIQSTPSGDYYVEFNTTRFSGFFLGPNRSLVFSQELNADPTKLMIQEVYPTPVLTELGVVFTAHQATSKGRIWVTDILGKTVLNNTINIESGRNEFKLNTSALATGLYILHISDGVYETAKKVIKQ